MWIIKNNGASLFSSSSFSTNSCVCSINYSTTTSVIPVKKSLKAAYPADAPYGRCFHWAAVREHLVILTPKQMHLVSDQNNRQTTFPVRRSAVHTDSAPSGIIHSTVDQPLVTVQRRRSTATVPLQDSAFCPPNPARILYVVPASKPTLVTSVDVSASVRSGCVTFSHPSAAQAHLSWVACVRSMLLARNWTLERQPPLAFHRLINGVWFIRPDVDVLHVGRCRHYILFLIEHVIG